MWFWIWSGLVVATLLCAAWLGRRLWHSLKALGTEAGRASALMAEASDRVADLTERMAAAQPSTAPTLNDDPVVLRARVAELRSVRLESRSQRRRRHMGTWESWLSFNE